MKHRKTVLVGLGNRCEVSAWIPPAHVAEIAQERTEGIVTYYMRASSPMSLHQGIRDLETLARSCYLQGINDMLDAIKITKEAECK